MTAVAIACSTGGFKGAFIHGVLAAFEAGGFRADAYASASSSVVPAAAAVVGRAVELGVDWWHTGLEYAQQPGIGMSEMVQTGIDLAAPWLTRDLFEPGRPRFLIAANAVDEAGAIETQGQKGRRRGRLLLLAAARGDRSWVDEHLTLHLFDTSATAAYQLTPQNITEVAYASSRMMHAWDKPAWIGDRPYVDAFYTCACPAVELAELGYSRVIALANEPVAYRDIFQSARVPAAWEGVPIETIAPPVDPAEMDVDYTAATPDGLTAVYHLGFQQGRQFLSL